MHIHHLSGGALLVLGFIVLLILAARS